jgi:ABC-2 type transport system ATP-binding protein
MPSSTQPIITISGLSKTLGKTEVLHNINLSIYEGEVFGFLGPNGAGKTTTMKAVLGILQPTTGGVLLFGKSPTDISVQKRIGFMPENTYLYKYLTADEFLDFNGKFYDMTPTLLEKRKTEVLEKVGLTGARHKRLNTYSKGMLQRIGLAQAILHDPEVILLDEPMSGLDPVGRKMVKDLMLELKAAGKTLFFNTHILSDVEAICDSFAIIAKGKIVEHMQVKNLKTPLEELFMERVGDNHTGQ